MYKYTHVDAFYQVVRHVKTFNDLAIDNAEFTTRRVTSPVTFRGSVKLHGTNASVVCSSSGLTAQSRNRQLTVDSDNAGFARFVAGDQQTSAIRELEAEIRRDHEVPDAVDVVIYGEWCGPGIQSGVGICNLKERQWALFAVAIVEAGIPRHIDAVPRLLERFADCNIYSVYDVDSMLLDRWRLHVDFDDKCSLDLVVNEAEAYTTAVENMCPWAARFGIEGMGEGIVWVPIAEHWGDTNLFFKTKGDKHKEVKRKPRHTSAVDPEVISSIAEFVEFSVTDVRLQKGLDHLVEMGMPIDMKSMPDFLRWIARDIERECALELQDNALEWKRVAKAVNGKAAAYFKRCMMT